jgi:hypothetical protein
MGNICGAPNRGKDNLEAQDLDNKIGRNKKNAVSDMLNPNHCTFV